MRSSNQGLRASEGQGLEVSDSDPNRPNSAELEKKKSFRRSDVFNEPAWSGWLVQYPEACALASNRADFGIEKAKVEILTWSRERREKVIIAKSPLLDEPHVNFISVRGRETRDPLQSPYRSEVCYRSRFSIALVEPVRSLGPSHRKRKRIE